ncbi:MAG: phosphoserine phosphatase SerB [Nitrosomonadaceae bacterium]|nr:phosphoserine phosphatase SerB [Nitrosospira sp.]MBI0418544.1 phosphoserine phosphatase SerB [Nitrosospira sp.]MDW7652764.1 phosphoserine phosphatase SerB [Nitrosomonadaceae bacterium]
MNLIIQGLEIETSDLVKLKKFSGAKRIVKITDQAFRLIDASQQHEIPEFCSSAKLDFSFVKPLLRLADFGLVAIDMDSTLVNAESIDEVADMHGIKSQVAKITASAMRGEIEFSEGFRQRVTLLKGLNQGVLEKVYDERIKLNSGAERMLREMKLMGIKIILISGGFSFFTDRLKKKLGLDYAFANRIEIVNGKFTGKVLGEIIDAQKKSEILRNICKELNLRKNQSIAIGDGANDLQMLAEAGVSIAYHAKPIIQRNATHIINYVGLDGIINLFE